MKKVPLGEYDDNYSLKILKQPLIVKKKILKEPCIDYKIIGHIMQKVSEAHSFTDGIQSIGYMDMEGH